MELDLSAWPGLLLGERLDEGHRNSHWLGTIGDERVVVRRIRRSLPSLEWELQLIAFLDSCGILVPTAVLTKDGERHSGGIAVQRWLHGQVPQSDADWEAVATELRRVHELTSGYPQRPDACMTSELGGQRKSIDADLDLMPSAAQDLLLEVFDQFEGVERAVIHGDPNASNIRIQDDGRVGFLDWDEARVDIVWHDLSSLGVQVLADDDHVRAQRLSHAWEAVNGWLIEPEYARGRLRQLEEM